jgi:mono/diheme cytochrome c family protein
LISTITDMKKIVFRGLLLFAIVALIAVAMQSSSDRSIQDDPWFVPEKFVSMDNPISGQIELGKEMYTVHCKSCHGKEGLGDGPKAAQLDTEPGDFTDENFQKQSDGTLFYKIWIGKDDMLGFDKKLSQTETWAVINYIRKFE